MTDTTDLIAKELENPVALFTDEKRFDEFYKRVKAETEKLDPGLDLKIAKDRDEIKSMAFKVTKTKTTLEKAAKALTEEWRLKTKAVNDARGKMVSDLDALADEVRRPVTQWEAAEDARITKAKETIAWFQQCAVVTIADTSEIIAARGNKVWETEIDPDAFAGFVDQAQHAKDATVKVLFEAKARLEQEEKDRAELQALRAAAEAREEVERVAREEAAAKQQMEEQHKLAAQAAAEAKEREEEAERTRQAEAARIAQEAAEAARAKAAEEAQAEIDAANQRAAALEQERVARDEREAQAAREQAEREANQAHRTKIMSEAKAAIMTCGADEDTARKIVLAIRAGEVPNVALTF